VAILVQPHSEFLKVFHKKSNRHKQVSLEQSGEQRAHIAQLEALGFTVIIVSMSTLMHSNILWLCCIWLRI